MNPVTRRLLDEIDDPDLAEFALAWDGFEELVVRLYRKGKDTPDEAEQYSRRRQSVRQVIQRWLEELEPYWKATQVDGVPPRQSPFLDILTVEEARGVVGNWELMRRLPAAREALNHLLLDRGAQPQPRGSTPRS
jgi:hypothetical protein